MAEYKTPGVYVEEISTFPPSVVRVATAVPAFVSCTERFTYKGADLRNVPTKVKSLTEFEQIFGGEPTTTGRSLNVVLNSSFKPTTTTVSLTYYLYQSLRHFYANGGGDCYIVSIGNYGTAVTDVLLNAGVDSLEKADEPTLILTPDAYNLSTTLLGNVQNHVLAHCNKMQDRFAIFDVKDTGDETVDAAAYRNKIGTQYLKYGAAYYPSLQSTLTPNGDIAVANLTITGVPLTGGLPSNSGDAAIDLFLNAPVDKPALAAVLAAAPVNGADFTADYAAVTNGVNTPASFKTELNARLSIIKKVIDVIHGFGDATKYSAAHIARYAQTIDAASSVIKDLVNELWNYDDGFRKLETAGATAVGVFTTASYNPAVYTGAPTYTLAALTTVPSPVFIDATKTKESVIAARPRLAEIFNQALSILNNAKTTLDSGLLESTLFSTSKIMAEIRDAVRAAGYILPPAGAVAGIYASVDADRGVWKAPANVSLTAVASVTKMRDDQIENLNVDTSGKSINAIRFFRGQGILVYGARTLAGNDNEWRYVPVRRLFIMVEESIKKATEPFVFEPNDANTWQRVKGMCENFLTGIWRDGALAGGIPKDAFFVKVGLNQTMTAQDVLEGKLIVEIGMAAVRPAEFIILKFMHKLQES